MGAASFFVTGGTLHYDAPSYVARQADTDLYEGLSHGEFCYVLTARQMGKSSLMTRTAHRLRQAGIAVVVLDLTAIGQNLSPEQWYDGLLSQLGQSLDPSASSGQALEDALDDFWRDHPRLGPLQRWMAALRQVVLAHVLGRIVIFIDEIDTVQSLPFSTDEFFAGIRECYNRRAEDPEFARLTFCLLGVASPSDLIRDTRTTPFNIGRRIELTDFTEAEAAPLAEGLLIYPSQAERGAGRNPLRPSPSPPGKGRLTRADESVAVLRRILYWTGGHPYLTQRLCQAVAEAPNATGSSGVDQLCEALFLAPRARERDDNLLFVRERLLRPGTREAGGADLASLLDLYGQVRRGRRVREDETNALVSPLRLSGITRGDRGWLRVRNRIYARVFDQAWITTHMPDAELRRQRAAYRRGVLRATALLGVILAVVGSLAITAIDQAHLARRATAREARQRQAAEEGQQTLRRYLYGAQMNLAYQAWDQGDIRRAKELLETQRPGPGEEDRRGFEWRYLWRLCRQSGALFTLPGGTITFANIAFAPDGKTLATASADNSVTLWNLATRRKEAVLKGHKAPVFGLAFSPNGKMLATGSEDRTLKLWEIRWRRPVATLKGHTMLIFAVAFSPDGRLVATGGAGGAESLSPGELILWDVRARRAIATVTKEQRAVASLAFTPDGKTLVIGNSDNALRLWDIRTRRTVAHLKAGPGWVFAVAVSPDGKTIATSNQENDIKLWDAVTKRPAGTLSGHGGPILGLAFSPDGGTLASGSADSSIRLWDVATRRTKASLREHAGAVTDVAFSLDGRTLASESVDHTVKLWNAGKEMPTAVVLRHPDWVKCVTFAPRHSHAKTLASSCNDNWVRLWDLGSGRVRATFRGRDDLAFSPDGRLLASASVDRTVRLWDVSAGRALAPLVGHKGRVMSVVFSPDGKLLASGCQADDSVRLWNVATRRLVATLPGYPLWVKCLAFSPDGRALAVASGNLVKRWDVASRRELAPLRGPADMANTVVYSPDGTILATAGWLTEPSVRIWDVGRQREVARLQTGWTWPLAFSPDGKTLVTGGTDHQVRLWDVAQRQLMATLTGHTGAIDYLAFSPDGNTLASASADGTVRLWHAAPFAETDAQNRARSRQSDR